MRIWDIEPKYLCRQHLLAEHNELHAIWSIITQNKTGFSNHPETMRWRGKLKALYLRHQQQVKEMTKRGYQHKSFLNKKLAKGKDTQDYLLDSIERQKNMLKNRKCDCWLARNNQKY